MKSLIIYVFISLGLTALDVMLAVKSRNRGRLTGDYLCNTCICAAVVNLLYLFRLFVRDYTIYSMLTSAYFIGINLMLICLLVFVADYTKWTIGRGSRLFFRCVLLYAGFEALVFALNPFWELAISYVYSSSPVAKYIYQMKPLFIMHLMFSYVLAVPSVLLLTVKLIKVPWEYRQQYFFVIFSILAVLVNNALFLFIPGFSARHLVDYSVIGYSAALSVIYWSGYKYTTHAMLNRFRSFVFDNIDRGLVLFDYEDRMILCNEKALYMLPTLTLNDRLSFRRFLSESGIALGDEIERSDFSFQRYLYSFSASKPLRCDCKTLTNSKGKHLGRLLVLSDGQLQTDLLTGFHSWESFRQTAYELRSSGRRPSCAAICDINGLGGINDRKGQGAGDRLIQQLAKAMKEAFPIGSYFVRGPEASLVVLSYDMDEGEALRCMGECVDAMDVELEYAVSSREAGDEGALDLINRAQTAMRNKKLLDNSSRRSDTLTSLIRALQECDGDTEAHVRRTQVMGLELGRLIGLNDVQQSSLALLCLLHDIGKIGIPLEILNKPGKLSAAEWKIIRSHVYKGSQIAASSKELSALAEDILHHHERWDGGGYPDKLKGREIPLLARVISVVDAYDAMTSNRVYRPAISQAAAAEELSRCAGTQFDPDIVAAFTALLREKPEKLSFDKTLARDSYIAPSQVISGGGQEQGTYLGGATHGVSYSRYITDDNMNILTVDDAFTALTGYTREDVDKLSLNQMDLIPVEERTEYLCEVNAQLSASGMAFLEHRLCRKDGSAFYVFCLGKKYFDSAEREGRSEIIITDSAQTYILKTVTGAERERPPLIEQISNLTRDILTGLPDATRFKSGAESLLEQEDKRILMLRLDIDNFTAYNESHGRDAGDAFLVRLAHTLSESLRKEDLACRLGADEFAVALSVNWDMPPRQIFSCVRQLYDRLSVELGGKDGISFSMGAVVSHRGDSYQQLYDEAENALYSAKAEGQGRLKCVGISPAAAE